MAHLRSAIRRKAIQTDDPINVLQAMQLFSRSMVLPGQSKMPRRNNLRSIRR